MTGDLHPSSTHPPLPPTTEDIRYLHLRLLRSRRVGASTYHRLLAEHGTASAALEALPQIAAEAGVSDYQICPEGVVAAELKAGQKARATLLIHGFAGYPRALMDLEDAPPLLWAIGDLTLLERDIITVVGARNASALGMRTANSLARDLSDEGYPLVAGLARGIDTAVHNAACDQGTIAVHASGVDVIYPSENTELAAKIARKGVRLSEHPPGTHAAARHFPARNRILAGLGQACVLIEAALKSDSIKTAREATDLGRDVLAVPGHPFDARSAGCNALIRDGAILIRGAQDVIEAVQPIARVPLNKLSQGAPVIDRFSTISMGTKKPDDTQASTQALHGDILRQLGPDPVAIDQLIRTLRASPGDLGQVLTELELNGQIKRHAGGLLSRCA